MAVLFLTSDYYNMMKTASVISQAVCQCKKKVQLHKDVITKLVIKGKKLESSTWDKVAQIPFS